LSESDAQPTTGANAAGYTGRTAWARNLAAPVRDFLQAETGGAAVMLAAVVVALLWANSPWSESYESLWSTKLSIQLGGAEISADLRQWIGEGLMAIFFLVVGLEAKRELDVGQLRERSRAAIPAVAAVGGVLTPIAIFLAFNGGGGSAHGWGVVMSTDTAFALGMLALVAPGGTRLRVALLAFAVADDLIALLVIATVYTETLKPLSLTIAVVLFLALLALRYAPAAWRRQAAVALGVGIWIALFDSGVDPIVAGLAVGLVTSAYPPERARLEQVTELTRSFREQPTPELARSAQLGVASAISPNERLQHRLHPWTSYLIVPLFALANAGIHVDPTLLHDAIRSPLTVGIVCASVLGKPLGIVGASWLASRPRLGGVRPALSWPSIAGGGVVSGIGFTVALLVADRAFSGEQLDEAKLGVLLAGALASFGAWSAFRLIARLPGRVRARQVAGTREAILDLSEEVDPRRDHVRGGEGALVTLIEYGDYECPYCGQAERAIRELLESFGDDLRYVWRHLPLNDVHPHAQLAAEATEAAHAQGAFWGMHDTLLEHQEELTPADLERDAERLGLDVERFWEELRAGAHLGRVEGDVASADASGVAGTPSFFVNGRRHHGAYDAASLAAAVRAARNRAHLRERARAGALA
jgi:Na+/H+ antiporter NhaA